MNKIKRLFIFFLTFLMIISAVPFSVSASDGEIYYVDSVSGNDENSGKSESSAWKTLEKVSSFDFSAGDKILLKRGESFEGTLFPKVSGTQDERITVSSYGEGRIPVIFNASTMLVALVNISNWSFEGIEFTAPTGYGFAVIATENNTMENITVENCVFHDISMDSTDTGTAALFQTTDKSGAKVNGLHVRNCEFYNCSWGIHSSGVNAERDQDVFESSEKNYHKNWLIENCYFHENKCAGIVLCSVKDGVVRNCKVENCATVQEDAYAPLWMHHADNVTVEYCEICGSTNPRDGMAIDFDGWTVNSTYDHIYSHDNTRFMRNCVFDLKTKNNGNTVKNCISVNDNQAVNFSASMLISTHNPSLSPMTGFTFSDNIIVNGTPILWWFTPFAKVTGNTFSGNALNLIFAYFMNFYTFPKGSKYVKSVDNLDEKIAEITERISF